MARPDVVQRSGAPGGTARTARGSAQAPTTAPAPGAETIDPVAPALGEPDTNGARLEIHLSWTDAEGLGDPEPDAVHQTDQSTEM